MQSHVFSFSHWVSGGSSDCDVLVLRLCACWVYRRVSHLQTHSSSFVLDKLRSLSELSE